jgi:Uma2 family endonuclease
MNVKLSKAAQRIAYEKEAQEYLRSLPLEHFMESTTQATQRKITLESLDLVYARRPEVQVFNELLVQYPRPGQSKLGKVVPDNMVVITDEAVRARLSYGVPLEPAAPFWTLEYVSKGSNRKDYEDSFRKYERDLKVPYYLIFHPEKQELTLYRHNGRRYVTVKRNVRGRYAIPELDLEVAILDGWVRYWYQGELLPLPADLQKELDEALAKIEEVERQAYNQKRRADELQQRLEAAERELAELRGGRKKRNSNTRSSDH